MVNFAISLVATAATNVINFINTNKRLPDFVTINNTQIAMPDFLYTLVTAIIQLNQNNDALLTLKNVSPATNPTRNFKTGSNIQKAEYLTVAQSIKTFIDNNSIEPNYATTTIGTLASDDLVYTYTLILDWFISNGHVLPAYVTVNSLPVDPTPTCGPIQTQIQAGTKKTWTTFTEFYNLIQQLGKYGYYFNNGKTLPQEIKAIIDMLNGVNNGVKDQMNCVDFCLFGVNLSEEMGYTAIPYGIYCTADKIWHAIFLINGKEFEGSTCVINGVTVPGSLIDLAAASDQQYAIKTHWCDGQMVEKPSWIAYTTGIIEEIKKGDDKLTLKLGKLGKKQDYRTLQYKNYNANINVVVPDEFGHEDLISDGAGMLANGPDDSVFPGFQGCGCCTFSDRGHTCILWNKEGQHPVTITGKETVSDYSALTNYDPQTGENDNGCAILDVLNYALNTGILDADGNRHKIGAFLELDITNIDEVKEAMYIFSDVTVGIQFPDSAMNQFNAGGVVIWDVEPNATIDGAHDVPLYGTAKVVGYSDGIFYLDTWDKIIGMTLAFFKKYVDEGYVILSPEFLNSQGVSPEGFDLPTLQADLAALPNQNPTPVTTLPTHVAVDPISGNTGDNVTLTAELIETDNTAYLPNETVDFSVNGIDLGTAVTDENGKASMAIAITEDAGKYPIIVTFAGDSNYTTSQGNNDLTVSGSAPVNPTPDIDQAITCIDTAIGCLKQAKKILKDVQSEERVESEADDKYVKAIEIVKDALKDI
jgi:hypothetical protein